MNSVIKHEYEIDGRRMVEIPELPGVLAYGSTAEEASARVEALALSVVAERSGNHEA